MVELNMNSLPLVTIITPAYNRETLVAETIESVLAQDYPNIEYIVLDDGSKDGTLEVIKKYEGRLRWESHPNMGETRTVNKGFAMARGEIIGVVNSDDPLLPGAVSKLVAALIEHPEVVVVYPDWLIINERGEVRQEMSSPDFSGAANMIRRHHCLPGPGAFFRRAVVEKVGGRDPRFRYVGDLEFWFRAVLVGFFYRVPETLVTFRVHSDSASMSAKGETMAQEHIHMVETFFARTDLPEKIISLHDEALSSAAFIAGCNCARWDFSGKTRYFAQALKLAPQKYLGEYAGRLLNMFVVLAGIDNTQAYLAYQRLSRIKMIFR